MDGAMGAVQPAITIITRMGKKKNFFMRISLFSSSVPGPSLLGSKVDEEMAKTYIVRKVMTDLQWKLDKEDSGSL